MGIRKFRSVEEMPPPPPLPPLTAETLRRAFEHMELSIRLSPLIYTPGVRKFRSLDEANRHREAVETAQIRRRRADRTKA
jgi:hypothetical protein